VKQHYLQSQYRGIIVSQSRKPPHFREHASTGGRANRQSVPGSPAVVGLVERFVRDGNGRVWDSMARRARAIGLMRQQFKPLCRSARHEPDYTCPTPHARRSDKIQDIYRRIGKSSQRPIMRSGHGAALDYIFVNEHVRVRTARLSFNHPAPHDPTLTRLIIAVWRPRHDGG
jgi:hypothetical protein